MAIVLPTDTDRAEQVAFGQPDDGRVVGLLRV